MKLRIFYSFIFLVVFAGCSNLNEKYNDIEIMSYHWSNYQKSKYPIKFHFYALIDKNGLGRVCVKKMKTDYFIIKIPDSLINIVLEASNKFLNDSNMRYNKITEGMMDEDLIKLRINEQKLSKTINFINTDRIPGIIIFMKLYRYIDVISMSGNYEKLNDTITLANRCENFIKYSMSIDTTLIPPPQKPIDSL